jgi:hypothetical protein
MFVGVSSSHDGRELSGEGSSSFHGSISFGLLFVQ